MEAVLVRVVGTELRRFLDHLAITELAGNRPCLGTLPALPGLDAKQVMAAAAILLAHDRLTPTRLQRGLGHQVARVDADTLGRLLGHGQHGGDKLVLRTEGLFRRGQRWLGHGTTVDLHARIVGGKRARGPLDHAIFGGTVAQWRSLGSPRRLDARHDTGQQAISEFARQGDAPLIHQGHVIAQGAVIGPWHHLDPRRP